VEIKKEAEYFGDIIIVPYMDHYDLVVLKTVAICEYGVSDRRGKHVAYLYVVYIVKLIYYWLLLNTIFCRYARWLLSIS
jgi:hypothetical protein